MGKRTNGSTGHLDRLRDNFVGKIGSSLSCLGCNEVSAVDQSRPERVDG